MKRSAPHLEHKTLQILKALPRTPGETWLIAVSGGIDSMALLEALASWRRYLKVELIIAHVHHGHGDGDFRDRARASVREKARALGCAFVSNRVLRESQKPNETEFREFRYRCLRRWARESGARKIVLAQHADDLLETRLLRLIRGTGAAGLRAMSLNTAEFLRPWLGITKAEIHEYARLKKLSWLDDPSNVETDFTLRNWLRKTWIPALETRQEGATQAMARSLELIASVCDAGSLRRERAASVHVGLRREGLTAEHIANYLRELGLQNYGRTHVEEIMKRLRSRARHFAFEILGLRFHVEPDFVRASRV